MRKNTYEVSPATGGMTMITVTAYDPRTNRPAVSLSNEFSQDEIRRFVADLCRCARLPEPWKRG